MGLDRRVSTHAPGPPDEDDDDLAALRWAGDDARGQAGPRLGGEADAGLPPELADEVPLESTAPGPRERGIQLGTIAFGLVYLAISIGWIFSVQLLVYPGLDLPGEIMWQFGEFLAMVAAALWFAAALTLTPEGASRRGVKRMLALLVGALVLVPWPALAYWIESAQ